MNGTITDVPGIKVGHATNGEALTGCTVVLCEDGAVGGVDQRGGAPGTRETDLLRPMHLVRSVHAVMLAGGSAFGLAAADGAMRYLVEHGIGYGAAPTRVPIVPAAILFDLAVGRPDVWPDAAMGYAACQAATADPVAGGNVGAGTGCTAGKALGPALATKTGIGSASLRLDGGLVVGALIAVNPYGDVLAEDGQILAGTRLAQDGRFAGTLALLRDRDAQRALQADGATVIGVIATNARLTKEEVNKVAQMAHDGVARAIVPSHTLFDGDTLFALATGRLRTSVTVVGAYAAEVTAIAIRRAARQAQPAGGLPAAAAIAAA
ncbi:MAG TPA: P1 family peptidase [Anaerolineae bacterium]